MMIIPFGEHQSVTDNFISNTDLRITVTGFTDPEVTQGSAILATAEDFHATARSHLQTLFRLIFSLMPATLQKVIRTPGLRLLCL